MLKTLTKLGIQENFLTLINIIYKNSCGYHTQWRKTGCFPSKVGNIARIFTLTTHIQYCIENHSAKIQEKELKGMQIGEGGNKTVFFLR